MYKQLEDYIGLEGCKGLEDYMEQVAQQIVSIPKPRRDEELKEIHTHLLMAVTANLEQGQVEEVAIANALQAFGTPAEASASVLFAWRRFVQKHIRKGFWRVGGIWSIFFCFMTLFTTNPSERYHWLLGLAFTWLICFIGMILSPLWALRVRSVQSAMR